MEPRAPGPGTRAVHAGTPEPRAGEPVIPPLVQSATFFVEPGGGGPLRYTRYGNNPTVEALARKLAALEGTEAALPVASGMAATTLTLLALTRSGDHVVASRSLYGHTHRFLSDELPLRGVETTFVDPGDREEWRDAVRDETRVLFLEIPTNPTLRVPDPRPVAHLARELGVALAVDATFASPVNFRAAEWGATVVIQSATKYLGGHSDLVAGSVAGATDVVERVREKLELYGPALDPHAAFLLDRGIRTLGVRVARQNETALALAEWFRERPGVTAVVHPGLPDHPDHDVVGELFRGYGGMLGVVVEGGGAAADRFCGALEVALSAPSLGGVETLVSQPRHTSHRGLTSAGRAELGIPDGFVRISVGLEDVGDLVADFGRALRAAAG